MNESGNEERKTTVIKTLAIIGFIVALILVAWLAVQAVRLGPAAFDKLASIADGLHKDKDTEFTIATGTVTVVNPDIHANDGVATNNPPAEPDEDDAPLDTIPNTGLDEEPDVPAPITPAPQPTLYKTVPVTVTTVPVSNPNGYTDLAVRFIGVGTYNGGTKTFNAKTSLDEDELGALQFEVKNIGTKTSSEWYFTASLPTDSDFTYRSNANVPLKPNERQIVTLQFDGMSEDNSARVSATITGGSDTTAANNSFSKQIEIRD